MNNEEAISKLAEEKYPYWNHKPTDERVDAVRMAFIEGYKAALNSSVPSELDMDVYVLSDETTSVKLVEYADDLVNGELFPLRFRSLKKVKLSQLSSNSVGGVQSLQWVKANELLETLKDFVNSAKNKYGFTIHQIQKADKLISESELSTQPKTCTGKEFECELATMLENIPQNRPIYKDSGLWQIRSDDMKEVLFQQEVNESFFDFIKRAYEKENAFMNF